MTDENGITTNTISTIGEITQLELTSALYTKQDTLTAGNNITLDIITDENGITTNTISAIGEITQEELTTALDTKQDILTAGNNVTIDKITDINGITTNTISAIGAGVSFEAGTNIDINVNVISTSQNVAFNTITASTITATSDLIVNSKNVLNELTNKQDTIDIYDNLMLNSMYVSPFSNKNIARNKWRVEGVYNKR
jgi:hypothetical protein